jgi:hypothetical protein
MLIDAKRAHGGQDVGVRGADDRLLSPVFTEPRGNPTDGHGHGNPRYAGVRCRGTLRRGDPVAELAWRLADHDERCQSIGQRRVGNRIRKVNAAGISLRSPAQQTGLHLAKGVA